MQIGALGDIHGEFETVHSVMRRHVEVLLWVCVGDVASNDGEYFAPEVPIGYDYTTGLTEESPPDKVLIEDKFASREHQRVIVHVDMSGEVTPEP